MNHRSLAVSCLFLALMAGCPTTHVVPVDPLVRDTEASATIGAAGGTLELGSLELVVPPGALSSDTTIRAVVTRTPIPGLFTGYSPIVRFEPDGLSFDAPVEVRVPFEGDAALATVFWSQRDGESYVARPTRVVGGYAIATTTHFSSAFVGTACSGDDCCSPANGELDLLLVVDDSGSMGEEQALLRAEIPRLARILASGDRNGDGVQDFPALASIHVGVTSTDLGVGELTGVPGCDPGYGRDGILVSTADTATAGCAAVYPSGTIEYEDGTDLDTFVTQLGCVANLGTGGCGFEQQLEATLIALSPEAPAGYTDAGYVAPSFLYGRPGHGDGANLGFARDASILAVLEVTDETDTSTSDIELFSIESPEYAGINLNLRGTAAGGDSAEALFPVSRYVDGLLALRTSPADLIFGAVAGVPSEMVSDPIHVDFEALLAHSAMSEVADAADPVPLRLAPVCDSEMGTAFPARRIVETAAGIDAAGGGTVIGSICEPSFDAIIDGLIERIAARASGSCG